MVAPVKLAGIGLVSLGVVGGGVGAYYALQPESISIEKKLSEENKKILGEGDATLWGIKLATYNRIKKNNKELNLDTPTWDKLKSWCSQKTKDAFNEKNKTLYEAIKQICVVPSHREKFENEKNTLADSQDWTAKAGTYQGNEIKGVTKGTDTAKQLENWCKKELDNEYENAEKNQYPLVLKWCTKKGTE